MSEDLVTIKAELAALSQQMVGVSEHRSRLMVLLTERSREIADLSTELVRVKTEGLRHLEEAQSAARQLRRANERLAELSSTKHSLSTEHSQLHDELEALRWELATARSATAKADVSQQAATAELSLLKQEVDTVRRTFEAKQGAWEQEREQLKMTVNGLSLEIQNEHQAARILERRWVMTETDAGAVRSAHPESARDGAALDYRLARTAALEEELRQLREEHATMSARLREFGRQAYFSMELEKAQQELRDLQVIRQLLERKLEDAEHRDDERQSLRDRTKELELQLRETQSLRAEVDRLRAKLYKTPLTSGTFPALLRSDSAEDSLNASRDLNHVLTEFAQRFDALSVVVADGLGFPVAATGTTVDGDGLAAIAGEADRLRLQAHQILGLSEITQLRLEDREGQLALFRYFPYEGAIMSIVTLGTDIPSKEDLNRMVGLTCQTLSTPHRNRDVERPRADLRSSAPVPRESTIRDLQGVTVERKTESR